MVRQLNTFRDHLSTAFGSPDMPVTPPGNDGKPWRITTRQFRRTIARHIANRPFGTIAGMIQYQHASVAAFEGFAGTSVLRAEVEAQRRLGQIDDLLDYFDRRQGGLSVGGPAGPRIARTLDDAALKLATLPAMIAGRARLRVMLTSVARTFHVGPLADCFFDPAQPLTALCEPTRCPNACITARHRPAWERTAADAMAHLRERRISDPQRQALQRELDRLTAVVAGIDPPAP